MLRRVIIAAFSLAMLTIYATAQSFSSSNTSGSLLNIAGSDTPAGGSPGGMLINNLKTSEGWRSSGDQLPPDELDQNGDILAPYAVGKAGLQWMQPQAAEKPGNWIVTADGYGDVQVATFLPGAQNLSNVSCTGSSRGNGDCNNTACVGYRGYLSGTTLTITAASAASGCRLQVGEPIAASTTIFSGTYNDATGIVSLELSADVGISGPGHTLIITTIGNGAAGAVQQLNGTFSSMAGSNGKTLNYAAPRGLCGKSLTALSCTGGTYRFSTGEVESTLVNMWGVPTIITANGTGSGAMGSYVVNFSQKLASAGNSIAFVPGLRLVFKTTGYDSALAQEELQLILKSSTAGARVRWEGEYHSGDEAAYDAQNLTALGAITTSDYRTFISRIHPHVLRNLAFSSAVQTNISTWSSRRPTQYINWYGYEQRPNIYAGTPTYSFVNNVNEYAVDWYQNAGAPTDKEMLTLTLPRQSMQGANSLFSVNPFRGASCRTGAYPNTPVRGGSGSGATALVVCEDGKVNNVLILVGNGGNGYRVGDSVSVTSGGGTQDLSVGAVGYNAQFSADNGTSYKPIITTNGANLFDNTHQMPAGWTVTLTYDADFGAWMLGPDGVALSNNNASLYNPGPVEAFIQICTETNADPWLIEPIWAADPQTDFSAGEAKFIKQNYREMHPWFEMPNESWNQGQNQYIWFSGKATEWMAKDPNNWFQTIPVFTQLVANERGKAASTLGQAINSVYNNNALYEVVQGVHTIQGDSVSDAAGENEVLKSDSYVKQSFAPQTDYLKAPAYNYVSRIGVTSYWFVQTTLGLPHSTVGTFNLGPIGETPLAYQWFYGNAQTRASLQNTYANYGQSNILNYIGWYNVWETFATTCAGTRAAACAVRGIAAYEGGNSTGNNSVNGAIQSSSNGTYLDTTQSASGANNSRACALTLAPLMVGNGTTTFTGRITGNILVGDNIDPANGGGGQQNFSPGMLITGTGVATNTIVTGYERDPKEEQVTVTPAGQFTGTVRDMHLFGSGGYPGMPIALSNISETGGTNWAKLAARGNLTVGPGGTPQSLPIILNGAELDCSGYDALKSATVTYVGSANWVNTMRVESWTWPEIGAVDTSLFEEFVAQGGVNPSQLNDAEEAAPWHLEGFDIYGWYQFGKCSACNISQTTLTLGGTVTGEFKIGQSLLGRGVATLQTTAANTTIVSCTKGTGLGPCGTDAGDVLGLSQNAHSTQTGVAIASYYLPTLAGYNALQRWNRRP